MVTAERRSNGPPSRNPDWTRDEVILACDLVARTGWRSLSAANPAVIELSDLLKSVRIHAQAERRPTFRNANGVARKTADLATQHPDYPGRRTRGGSHDAQVLARFLSDPETMAATAAAIREEFLSNRISLSEELYIEEPAEEGGVLERRHLVRERDPKLRARKIQAAIRMGLPIACEICRFDFSVVYGVRGDGFIEVHHRLPLHVSGKTTTALADLAMVCSNCHRMIHRAQPWLTLADMTELMKSASQGNYMQADFAWP